MGRRRGVSMVAALVSGLLGLSACGASPEPVLKDAPRGPVSIKVVPADGAKDVRPDAKLALNVTNGRIISVKAVSARSQTPLEGTYDPTLTSWSATSALGGGEKYKVAVEILGEGGKVINKVSTFATQEPKGRASATVMPSPDQVVGVGMPIIVNFSRDIENRAAVTAALQVESVPAVEGAWRWTDDRSVHWRPKEFWPGNTKVKLTGRMATVEVAPGIWGQKDFTRSFSIGREQISTVDVAAHTLTVRREGRVIKEIPITTGKRGYETRAGTKVIITHERTRQMDAASTGVKPDDPEYYNLTVQYAMRLTWSGEFLHAAPWSVGSQGRANVSHGCTGMSTSYARWMFENSMIGDVVQYTNSSRDLEWGNGITDWNMDYDKWAAPAPAA